MGHQQTITSLFESSTTTKITDQAESIDLSRMHFYNDIYILVLKQSLSDQWLGRGSNDLLEAALP